MTTIVATTEALWCDSKVTVGDLSYPSDKVVRHKSELIGCSGDGSAIAKFLKWYRGTRKGKLVIGDDEGFCALVLSARGIYAYYGHEHGDKVLRDFHAIGSGAACAIGAMAAGADPQRAVEIACEFDNFSAPPVHEHRLKCPPRR